ncbi:angiotensin II receptor associated protein [Rhinolophus ferrumequinum]|uniref:Angiotensin II receptor associated protein n=1 Tax=Rhinolophus ferrumequinum TaxID=59479 RepID=A0A7J7X3M2_RHIFE|nr:type-1 angiotensin II receptor-associated protein isoform X3 [Rhinolophus ferrumequinum]KAF6343980.1 angiotensin II receptor associated protein [Rhinolophus ferrumequinum]
MELPAVNLKMILLVHWLLTTWGCLVFLGPYAWANFTILALGVWAVAQRDSIDAISMHNLTDTVHFGAGMAILNLLLKPFSCCLVYHMYRERGGELQLRVGFCGPSQEHSAYQTIDSPEVPSDPFASPESKGHTPQGY